MKDALLGLLLGTELQKEWLVLGPHDHLNGLWTIKKKLDFNGLWTIKKKLISPDLIHNKGTTPPGQDMCLGANLDTKSCEFLFCTFEVAISLSSWLHFLWLKIRKSPLPP